MEFVLKGISEIRMANVEKIMHDNQLSRKDFAEKSSITYNQFRQYLGKNPKEIISDDIARRIETAFGLERFWLDQNWQSLTIVNHGILVIGDNYVGHQAMQIGVQTAIQSHHLKNHSSDEGCTNRNKGVPLLDIDTGVNFALNPQDPTQAMWGDELVGVTLPHSEQAFGINNAVDIVGLMPSIIERGDILIVEPLMPPRDNDLVLVCLDYDTLNRGIIAQLFVDLQGNKIIKYQDSPPEPMPLNSLICGVVIEIHFSRMDTTLLKSRLNPKWDILQTLVYSDD